MNRSRPGGIPGSRARVRCPRAALQPAPGRHSGINRLALRLGRDENSLEWDRQGRVTPAQRDTQNVSPPGPRKQKPGAESLAMKDFLGREPRWNADRCAPGAPGAAVAVSHGRRALRLSAFRLRIFFVLFVRHPCRSFAGTAHPPAFSRVVSAWTTASSAVVTSQRQWRDRRVGIARVLKRIARRIKFVLAPTREYRSLSACSPARGATNRDLPEDFS